MPCVQRIAIRNIHRHIEACNTAEHATHLMSRVFLREFFDVLLEVSTINGEAVMHMNKTIVMPKLITQLQ